MSRGAEKYEDSVNCCESGANKSILEHDAPEINLACSKHFSICSFLDDGLSFKKSTQMASVRLDQDGDCIDKLLVEHLFPSDSSDVSDDFGEPDILPRIGDEYQLEIPPSIEKSLYISFTNNSTDAQNGVHSHHHFFIGLPMPLMWINTRGVWIKQEAWEEPKIASDFRSSQANNIKKKEYSYNENFGIKTEPSHYSVDSRREIRKSENLPLEDNLHQSSNQGYFLVPGLCSEHWTDIEEDSFLLGLYIFEKNFVQLRQFIENKEMRAILSFYYGKFYGTDKYHRWSEGRKMRSKKCVYGHKIFSGLRQPELLSRILPSMSEECQNALEEVSKSFGEGKMSLQDYISSLKTMVGMKVLVEAIAIGKGKQDLTRMALETSRSNQVVPIRPEIPTGKAWSSLSTSEIIKFLTGDYRLSKARSNDLFWEAVWPRLLARGWHSEKPKNQGYIAGSNHGLVFLFPGVKKFSRRKLVKGDHYFDSVSDVLSKVAKEPELLELEAEDDGNKNKEQDDHDLPMRQRHCYLQPRTPNRNSDIMKFMVVDTSLTDGKPYKLRELRSLPFEISNMLTSRNHSEVSDEESTDETTDESDTVNTMHVDSGVTDNASLHTTTSNEKMLPGRKDHDVNAPYQDIHTIGPNVDNILLSSLKNKKDLHEDKQSRKFINSRSSRKQKQDMDSIAPIRKLHQGLSACSCDETSNGGVHSLRVPRSENKISSCCSGVHEFSEYKSTEVGSSQDKLSSTSSPKGSPIGSVECTPNANIDAAEAPLENPQSQTLIDLNFPQVPMDMENGFLATESQNPSAIEASYDQQPSMNMPRHSTRNRPPTTRALEALANGLLTIKRRRKSKNTSSLENRTSDL
ncbi:unnamed protein product [Fraxinus pennsylvanica]|uniref:SANT domain-containing protein n=1 Tax=Fraxinus pennsylvanica TaxID=56036 RepID=A0AAD1Z6W5_9LAMI|nr:unnamed protein product [Fraxinus pennsylvanica]